MSNTTSKLKGKFIDINHYPWYSARPAWRVVVEASQDDPPAVNELVSIWKQDHNVVVRITRVVGFLGFHKGWCCQFENVGGR